MHEGLTDVMLTTKPRPDLSARSTKVRGFSQQNKITFSAKETVSKKIPRSPPVAAPYSPYTAKVSNIDKNETKQGRISFSEPMFLAC